MTSRTGRAWIVIGGGIAGLLAAIVAADAAADFS
jgi:succinate dehydrogenase/fumarate reductase flavoprotein subunit